MSFSKKKKRKKFLNVLRQEYLLDLCNKRTNPHLTVVMRLKINLTNGNISSKKTPISHFSKTSGLEGCIPSLLRVSVSSVVHNNIRMTKNSCRIPVLCRKKKKNQLHLSLSRQFYLAALSSGL